MMELKQKAKRYYQLLQKGEKRSTLFFQISFLLEDPCVCIFLPTPRAFFKDAQEVLKNISWIQIRKAF